MPQPAIVSVPAACAHLGQATGETATCKTCKGSVQLKLFACEVYGTCTIAKKSGALACCAKCPSYTPKKES